LTVPVTPAVFDQCVQIVWIAAVRASVLSISASISGVLESSSLLSRMVNFMSCPGLLEIHHNPTFTANVINPLPDTPTNESLTSGGEELKIAA
jgi:hypothetical protein